MKVVILSIVLLSTFVAAVPLVTPKAFYAAESDAIRGKIYFIDEPYTTETQENRADIVPWELDDRALFSSVLTESAKCLVRCRRGQICLHGACRRAGLGGSRSQMYSVQWPRFHHVNNRLS